MGIGHKIPDVVRAPRLPLSTNPAAQGRRLQAVLTALGWKATRASAAHRHQHDEHQPLLQGPPPDQCEGRISHRQGHRPDDGLRLRRRPSRLDQNPTGMVARRLGVHQFRPCYFDQRLAVVTPLAQLQSQFADFGGVLVVGEQLRDVDSGLAQSLV
jgi:hypothetical protein